MQKNKAGQKTWDKLLFLLHKFTDELSVFLLNMKKRAKISRKAKTLEWMHKTPSKTKRKKSTQINTRKKSTPISEKVLASMCKVWA